MEELLVDTNGISDEGLEELGREMYREIFLNKGKVGELTLHNGDPVVFHEDRYDHAFRCSPNRARNPHSKKAVARDRIERMRWIKAILEGDIDDVECWIVPQQTKDRLYVVWKERYVIWLWSRKEGGWRFSSAYCAGRKDIRGYTRRGVKIKMNEKKMPRD
ncbi:hypothetical protein EGM51_09460 [Verrucomicrobia bacterium S94]|nr:hypothetical protein EGM51_09460 [Verrucomicrobia bacterium S94]